MTSQVSCAPSSALYTAAPFSPTASPALRRRCLHRVALGLASIVVAGLLAACGGGSGSGSGSGGDPGAPAKPASLGLSVAKGYSIKSFNFVWEQVDGATHYQLFEDIDGDGPQPPALVVPSGQILGGGSGNIFKLFFTHEVPLFQRLNARYTLKACNDLGCSAPSDAFAPDVNAAIGYLKASSPVANDNFGAALALSRDGNTLAVGVPSRNVIFDDAGAVYVLRRTAAGVWSDPVQLNAGLAASPTGDQFGKSVALSADGSTLAVGAPYEDSDSNAINGNDLDNTAGDAGAVYVFTRTGNDWDQPAYIKASNSDANDRFGNSVALSDDGNTLAVGAPYEDGDADAVYTNAGDMALDDNAAFNAGAVYIFTRDNTGEWSNQVYIKAYNSDQGDFFGNAVALSGSGDTLAVGATGEDGNSTEDSGAVYVFVRSVMGVWSQQARLKAENPLKNDFLGLSIALSGDGNTLAAGQVSDESGGAGAVHVFIRSSGVWGVPTLLQASHPQTSAYFGNAVALSNDGLTLAVGSQFADRPGAGLFANPAAEGGLVVSQGAVYLFSRSPAASAWTQTHYVKSSNAADPQSQWFGSAVALSGDGKSLAVGAPSEDNDAASGLGVTANPGGADQSGAVYLY